MARFGDQLGLKNEERGKYGLITLRWLQAEANNNTAAPHAAWLTDVHCTHPPACLPFVS